MNTPDTVSPQRILIPLGIGTALSLLGDNTLYTVLPNPDIAAQAGLTATTVGVMLGVNRIIRVFINGPVGILYDRMPRRRLLILSLFIGALSTGLYTIVDGTLLWLLSRIMWGVAWSGIWIGGNTAVLDISDDENRGRLSGQYQMWFFAGAALSATLGGRFTDVFGFRRGLLISAGITLLAALLWLIALPESRPDNDNPRTARVAKLSFPVKAVIAPAVPVFVTRFVFAGVVSATTILWLEDLIGKNATIFNSVIPLATLAGLIIGGRRISSVLGAPIAGYASDRLGHRWTVIAISTALAAAGMWLMGGQDIALALVGALFAAVASGSASALAPAIAGDRVGLDRQSRGLSIIFTLGDLGSAIAPPLALGLLNQLSIVAMYRISAGLFVAVTLFAVWQSAREKGHKQSTQVSIAKH